MGAQARGRHQRRPGAGKTAQAVASTRRLEDSLHASIVTIVPCLCKTMATATSAGYGLNMAPTMSQKCRAIWYEIFRLVHESRNGLSVSCLTLPTMRPLSLDKCGHRETQKQTQPREPQWN